MQQSTINIVLQGKGGVGKSLIASLIAQTIDTQRRHLLAIDTDPVNQTLASYAALDARTVELLDAERQVDHRAIDTMIDWLLAWHGDAVVDNGATSFVPVTGYLADTGALDVLQDAGKRVLVHTVLVGGQAFDDTLAGLSALLEATDAPLVVWLNEFFGAVERDGRGFADSALYSQHKDRIHGIVTLRRRHAGTYGADLAEVSSAYLTLEQAISDPQRSAMSAHRLRQIRDDVMGQLVPLLYAKHEAATN